MRKFLLLFPLLMCIVIIFSCTTRSAKEAKLTLPISGNAVLNKDHKPVPPEVTCAECHDVSYDAESNATKMWINNYKLFSKEEIWQWIVDFLPDRERFVVSTVGEDSIPTASTIDFHLIPEEKVFLCVNEKGTEKVIQLMKNPWVSMVHYVGSIEGPKAPEKRYWQSVQVLGKAKVLEPGTAEFEESLIKYKPARTSMDQSRKRFNMLKISIKKIIVFNSENMKNGYSPYQIWENKDFK